MRSKFLSRKFIGALLAQVALIAVILVSVLATKIQIDAGALIIYFLLTVFLWAAYMGSNVFQAYINSKFFKGSDK